MSGAEFIRRFGDQSDVELVQGQLVRLPMPGTEHGEIALRVGALLLSHVSKHKLGRVASNDPFIRVHRAPDTYRGADVCYISYKRLPKRVPTPKGPLEVAPDLVVEIRSPSDRLASLLKKAEEYLAAGVKAVIIVDAKAESIGVFRNDELPQRFHNGDTVTLSDVLPGFAAPVKAFFE
jgi:Uma2 family endonuclease